MTWFVSINHKTKSWKSSTSPCRWQAGRLICRAGGESRLGGRSGRRLVSQRLEHQEGVGQHHDRQMPMQPLPPTSLKLIQAAFPFGILIELFNRPAQMRQLDQARQGRLGRQGTEEPLGLAFLAWERAFAEQPSLWSRPTTPGCFAVTCTAGPGMDAQRHELLPQRALAAFAPLHRLPGLLRLGCGNHLGVVAWGWARLLRLAPLAGRGLSLGSRGLTPRVEQASPKVGSDRTDLRQSSLIQGAQKTGDAIACISHHGRNGDLPGQGAVQQVHGQVWFGSKGDRLRHASAATALSPLWPKPLADPNVP